MRVTSQLTAKQLIRNLQSGLRRMDRLNMDLSTGRRIHRPSDDPAGTFQSMRINRSITEVVQYQKNVAKARSWVELTDQALNEATDVMHRTRELAIYGANGTQTEEQRIAMAMELDQLVRSLIQVGNTRYGNRFIFAGQETLQRPFEEIPNPHPHLDERVDFAYHGSNPIDGGVVFEISEGVTIQVNVFGDEVIAPMIEAVMRIRDYLLDDDTDSLVHQGLADLDAALDTMLKWRAHLGARTERLDRVEERLGVAEITLTQLLSHTEDTDVARALMELKIEENVYRAALGVSARMMQPSLLDFLR